VEISLEYVPNYQSFKILTTECSIKYSLTYLLTHARTHLIVPSNESLTQCLLEDMLTRLHTQQEVAMIVSREYATMLMEGIKILLPYLTGNLLLQELVHIGKQEYVEGTHSPTHSLNYLLTYLLTYSLKVKSSSV